MSAAPGFTLKRGNELFTQGQKQILVRLQGGNGLLFMGFKRVLRSPKATLIFLPQERRLGARPVPLDTNLSVTPGLPFESQLALGWGVSMSP